MNGKERTENAERLIDEIVDELKSFYDTPPPRGAWLDLSNRLKDAFEEYKDASKEAFIEFLETAAKAVDKARDMLKPNGPVA